jgi:hypothetical protein
MSAWYEPGLCFACTRCGNCCTGEPGSVRVSEEELVELSGYLDLPEHEFRARYTRALEDGATSLVEHEDQSCIFFEREAGCTVYPVRPRQCRTWPFWRANLATPQHWAEAARTCPGIGRGPRHEAGWIAGTAAQDGTSGCVPDLSGPG